VMACVCACSIGSYALADAYNSATPMTTAGPQTRGSDSGTIRGSTYWQRAYPINGGWAFTVTNNGSATITVLLDGAGQANVAAGATRTFTGNHYGNWGVYINSPQTLNVQYWISYY
jgi:hypothetical protein